MLELRCPDKIKIVYIGTGVAKLKWRWAGHVVRHERWMSELNEWAREGLVDHPENGVTTLTASTEP